MTAFKINILISQKNFHLVDGKPGLFRDCHEQFEFKVARMALIQRAKFILSLLCRAPTEISLRFCDTSEMRQANHTFRGKNKLTDVLSFPYDELPINGANSYLGDILICVGVCQRQAKLAKIFFAQELEKMIIHGIVHLKGFDHERNLHAERVMQNLETTLQQELLKKLGKPKWLQGSLCE